MATLKKSASLLARLVALTIVLLAVSALGVQLLPAPDAGGAEGTPTPPGLGLIFALFFLQTTALAYPILRSRWSGWPLTAAIAVLFFGTVTFLSQIESLVYLGGRMPDGMLPGLFAMGLINAVVFAPVAVWLLGRWRRSSEKAADAGARLPWGRVAVAGLVMLALYYLFGYYVAWQNPAVRAYYGGTDPGSFFAQMASVVRGTPWMLPFQYLRGLIWAGLALLVVRAMRGRWWEAGLAAAILFTIPSLYLLLPNPLMPDQVRLAHLVETVPYQFLFGWFAAWWLRRRDAGTMATQAPETRPSRPPAGGTETSRAAAH